MRAPDRSAAQQVPGLPVGWYVHLPFCHTKCGYCDFYSVPNQPDAVGELTAAICAEMLRRDPGRPIATVFVGGGTPTVLPAIALEAILRAIPRRFAATEVEFTVEANPSSADELKMDLLRQCGVNRVSFGAQSFHRDELAVLERLHDPIHIPEAVQLARRAGFANINLDLIFGIPGQTLERWLDSPSRAVDLGVEHIACYSLMYEEGTALTKRRRMGQVQPIDEDVEAEMYERTIDTLTAAGYEHYEISNFARPGRRCRHNMVYWRNEEYVGIGPSAVSYLDGVRSKKAADYRQYIAALAGDNARRGGPTHVTTADGRHDERRLRLFAGHPDGLVIESEKLEGIAHARETAIQMLRLTEGIDTAYFRQRTGFDPLALFAGPIQQFTAGGLVDVVNGFIRLTRRGLLVANRVMQEFLGEPVSA